MGSFYEEDIQKVEEELETLQKRVRAEDADGAGLCFRNIVEPVVHSYTGIYMPECMAMSVHDQINQLAQRRYISDETETALHRFRMLANKSVHKDTSGGITLREVTEWTAVLEKEVARWKRCVQAHEEKAAMQADAANTHPEQDNATQENAVLQEESSSRTDTIDVTQLTADEAPHAVQERAKSSYKLYWMDPGKTTLPDYFPDKNEVLARYQEISSHPAFTGQVTGERGNWKKLGTYMQKGSDGIPIAVERILVLDQTDEPPRLLLRLYTKEGIYKEIPDPMELGEKYMLEYCGEKCQPNLYMNDISIRRMSQEEIRAWMAEQEAAWPERKRLAREAREAADEQKRKEEETAAIEEATEEAVNRHMSVLSKTGCLLLALVLGAACVALGLRQTQEFFTEGIYGDTGAYTLALYAGFLLYIFGGVYVRQICVNTRSFSGTVVLLLTGLYFLIPRCYMVREAYTHGKSFSMIIYAVGALIALIAIAVVYSSGQTDEKEKK